MYFNNYYSAQQVWYWKHSWLFHAWASVESKNIVSWCESFGFNNMGYFVLTEWKTRFQNTCKLKKNNQNIVKFFVIFPFLFRIRQKLFFFTPETSDLSFKIWSLKRLSCFFYFINCAFETLIPNFLIVTHAPKRTL